MREAHERGDDDADDDETKVSVWGSKRQKRGEQKRRSLRWLPEENCSTSPIAVNHVTWLHPVCSQLLTGLKAINSPAASLETDVMNGRERLRQRGRERHGEEDCGGKVMEIDMLDKVGGFNS